MRGKEILFVRAQKSTLVSREKENEVLWAEEMYFVFGPCRPEGEFYLSVISLSFVIMFSSVQLERWFPWSDILEGVPGTRLNPTCWHEQLATAERHPGSSLLLR